MAAADTAKMIAELSAKDLMSGTLKKVGGSVDTLDRKLGGLGNAARKGAKVAAGALIGIGAVAAGGVVLAVKQGLQDLATLGSAVTSVDGAIKQMGLTGQVTGAQIAGWANEIEASIGAAFDDKAITQATATLIRFGRLAPENIRPAMQIITDLATKTGDVDSAATLLAKALADPTKAAGKLSRQGIILTKVEQDQIKALVKAGKTGQAQKVILDALTRSTTGAAAASQGPYARALSVLADVSEDARKALAEGFLPVIERVSSILSKALADPKTVQDIRNLGQGLAGAFDQAVTFAQRIPWGSIRDAMQLAGQGAKAALDLFTGMPDWVKTAVLTGWGLNKLTGGAVSSIVGELGKGLIHGVLGMNAGVVNINAGVVNGGGGIPGGPTVPGVVGAAAGGGVVGTVIAASSVAAIGFAVTAGLTYGIPAIAREIWGVQPDPDPIDIRNTGEIAKKMVDALTPNAPGSPLGKSSKPPVGLGKAIATPIAAALSVVFERARQPALSAAIDKDIARLERLQSRLHQAKESGDRQRISALRDKMTTVSQRIDAEKQQLTSSVVAARDASAHAGITTTGAVNSGSSSVVAAIHGIQRPSVSTTVNVNVSASQVSKSVTVQERYGPGNGSAGGGSGTHPGGGGP